MYTDKFIKRYFGTSFGDAFKMIENQFGRPFAIALETPLINKIKIPQGYLYEIAMPGLSQSEIEISVNDGHILITGVRESRFANEQFCHREHSFESMSRTFSIPPETDEDSIKAKYEHGMLILTLNNIKNKSRKSKKIKIY